MGDVSDDELGYVESGDSLTPHGMLLGTPHRTLADGEVLLEWWNADRKLTVSIVGNDVQMLWSWERNGKMRLRDVENASPSSFALAWTWLNRKGPTAGSETAP